MRTISRIRKKPLEEDSLPIALPLARSLQHNQPITARRPAELFFDPIRRKRAISNFVDGYFDDAHSKDNESSKMPLLNSDRGAQVIRHRKSSLAKELNITWGKTSDLRDLKLRKVDDLCLSEALPIPTNQTSGIDSAKMTLSAPTQWLPPINESLDEGPSVPLSESIFIPQLSNIIQKTQLLAQNSVRRLLLRQADGKAKELKKDYKMGGLQIFRRELKALRLGVQSIWTESGRTPHSMTSDHCIPFSSQIRRITFDHSHATYIVHSTKLYKSLLMNNCETFLELLSRTCEDLLKISGRVLNNTISMDTIYLVNNSKLVLSEWGYSSFREEYLIQEASYESRVEPLLKSESEWFLAPAYLAPQILENLLGAENDLWAHTSASDAWSLGLFILEVLTLIPLAGNEKFSFKRKTAILRTGLLSNPSADIKGYIEKQRQLSKTVRKLLSTEVAGETVPQFLVGLTCRLLQFSPASRISLQELASTIVVQIKKGRLREES